MRDVVDGLGEVVDSVGIGEVKSRDVVYDVVV
jgi:hypothetical protein